VKASSLFKFVLWEWINPLLLNMNKNKIIGLDSRLHGINLGCGFDNPVNWLGLDGGASLWLIKKSPKFLLKRSYKNFNMSDTMPFNEYVEKVKAVSYVHYDITYGLPFRDGSVPNIFSSHFMEHLFRDDARNLLKECYRVIAKSGIIRIVVPSLDEAAMLVELAVQEFRKGNVEPIQKFVTNPDQGFMDKFSRHKWMYNFNELKNLLSEAGFEDIKECEFKKGNIPDVEQLDCRTGIVAEAVKK
jgi:predicted SAM-dependent methyltransferase